MGKRNKSEEDTNDNNETTEITTKSKENKKDTKTTTITSQTKTGEKNSKNSEETEQETTKKRKVNNPAGPSRKERRRNTFRDGEHIVIIKGDGIENNDIAIPVENIYKQRKQWEEQQKLLGNDPSSTSYSSLSSYHNNKNNRMAAPVGKFEECWICGGTDHRRSNCPNKQMDNDDGHMIQRKLVCLGCRRRGHVLANCPDRMNQKTFLNSSNTNAGNNNGPICFNCGEPGHNIYNCPEPKLATGANFATCFICHQPGHLSKDCPKNKHGLYPRGGGCKICGSNLHLVRDCPENRNNNHTENHTTNRNFDFNTRKRYAFGVSEEERAAAESWTSMPANNNEHKAKRETYNYDDEIEGNVAVKDSNTDDKKDTTKLGGFGKYKKHHQHNKHSKKNKD